ncbi:mitochondrial Hsp10 (chaperonin GroES) [Andalucia godoyi]|uniref:Mitochondrial Hsp10 (Chaperonin GroES) n=1 Tax=Andalucia godoyi TaxID=505711 RepID=A0A8K0F2J5_ANDGO|nr:mitochondrial Hsp10 (chaperonin GroES) [Andalucia godoyi]|eukprot:ANDGO_08310.mRNA.1 mitochondrial Hsp10 (chaperonin GroES)
MSQFKRLIPYLDRVLVEKVLQPAKTASGILLPESSSNKALNWGVVRAVGAGAPNRDGKVIPLDIKEGDKVLMPEFGGSKVNVEEGKELFLFRAEDLLGKLE